MRIGPSIASSHAAGMSALWHDPDLDDGLPLKRLDIPTVEKKIDDMPLPSEEHQLPAGVADPFDRMEASFDQAERQAVAGKRGLDFLNGKAPPTDLAEATEPQKPLRAPGSRERPLDASSETRTLHVQQHNEVGTLRASKAQDEQRFEREQLRRVSQATQAQPGPPSATATAARRESEKAAEAMHMAESLGIPASLAPTVVSQAAQAVSMPALVQSAVAVVGAAGAAVQIGSVAIAEGLKEEPVGIRRGLRHGSQPQRADPDDDTRRG